MVKLSVFKFRDPKGKVAWRDFAKFSELISHQQFLFKSVREVTLRLAAGEPYQISCDQSTSNSGIFIKNYRNTEAYMMEFSKERGHSVEDYLFDFEQLLHQVCKGANITHLVYERPISTESHRSSQVLFQLEGIIRVLPKRYSEFANARLEYIENSSWRRVVILPECKDYERKYASKASIEGVFDWTQLYGFSIGKDNDIYEALGVMFGWFLNSYDQLGRPYVRGDKFVGAIGGFVLVDATAKDVCEQLASIGINTKWAMQNPRKSVYENIASAVEKYKVACVELTDRFSMLAMSVECGLKWMDPEVMTVVLVAANYTDSKLFEITGKEYHFVF